MGRLTRDPEIKYTQSGAAVSSFSLAVDRRFVKQGEPRQTDFINCVVWRNTAEFITRYFKKGQMMNVVGSLQTRSWIDVNNQKRFATDVLVEEVNFCSSKSESSGEYRSDGTAFSSSPDFEDSTSNTNVGVADEDGFITIDTDDDLPF